MTENDLPRFTSILHKIMHYIPHVLIVMCILFGVIFAITNQYYFIRSLLLFVPLILTSVFLIVNKSLGCAGKLLELPINQKILEKIVLILLLSWFVSALALGFTSVIFLILAIFVYSIILIQVLSSNVNTSHVLFEILAAGFILVLSQMFLSPLWYADTDLISHYEWVSSISDSGYVQASILGSYGTFCLYHILLSMTNILTGMESNTALYLVSTVAVMLSIPVVYKIAYHFIGSKRISLLAAFFYSIMPMMLTAFLTPAPRVMASMAFIFIVYVLFSLYSKYKISSLILMVILATYMSLVHHAQLLFVLLVLFMLMVGMVLYSPRNFIKKLIPLSLMSLIPFLSLLIGYWSSIESIIKNRLFGVLSSGEFVETTHPTTPSEPTISPNINVGNPVVPSSPSAPVAIPNVDTPIVSPLVESMDLSSFLSHGLIMLSVIVLTVFCLIGIYSMITNSTTVKKFSHLIPLLLVLFVCFVPNVLDILQIFADSFQIYRIRIILAPFFAIAMAVGCCVILNLHGGKNTQLINKSIVICLCLMFVVGSVSIYGLRSNDIFADEDSMVSQNSPYYQDSDLAALNFIPEYVPYETSVLSNAGTSAYISRTLDLNKAYYTNYWDDNSLYLLFTTPDYSVEKPHYAIISHPKFDAIGLSFYASANYGDTQFLPVKKTPETTQIVSENLYSYDIIYDNYRQTIYDSN